ncbi:extracellular solute-binding protein [Marinimicrobium locisalis]|uniref:extracellular solute-binding protein n=1 Tax=Marinimicrobium locisalis TaxID=546022 RepID=UPI003221CE3D
MLMSRLNKHHTAKPLLFMLAGLLLSSTALADPLEPESATETTEENSVNIIKSHSFAGIGDPKYPADFEHFDYVNPEAPKGGELRRATIGTYDSFNRYASRGSSAIDSGDLYDPLMIGSLDEIDVYYPLIAEEIEYPANHMWVIFHINPQAKDQSGKAITAEDVKFTFNKFMTEGVPQFRASYSNVKDVEVLDSHRVKFSFEKPARDDIASLVSLSILPKHYWKERDFSEPLSEPPVGTGPYVITEYKMGQSVTYKRNPDYWAKDLPSRLGTLNFDILRYDYYRDTNVALEAFKAGQYDLRIESEAKKWEEDYDIDAVKEGRIVREELKHSEPQPMSAYVFNTQREIFKDRRVRHALNYALDFQWMNSNLFYSQYERNLSYFQNTEYMAEGSPSEDELEILTPIKDKLPKEVFGEVWRPNETDGSGNIRGALRKAMALLRDAGWELKDGKMAHGETGKPFEFEIIYYSPSSERALQPLKRNLERLGITMNLRMLDTSQFINRVRSGDYDMVDRGYQANPYPHRNMPIIWHSDYIESSWNQARVQDPVIDQLVTDIVAHQQQPEELLAYGRAFDRVALWNFYVIPKWHSDHYRVAHWDKFDRPETRPDYDLGIETWWYDKDKAQALKQ